MTRLVTPRLADQLQRRTDEYTYGSMAIYFPPPAIDAVLDEYGQPALVTAGTPIYCSFEIPSNQTQLLERWNAGMDISTTYAEIRFKGNVIPDKGGRFKVTGRFDQIDYLNETFEVVYVDNRGSFGYKCLLKQVKV